MSVPSLQEVVRTVGSVKGNNVSGSVYGIPLELFIVLVVIAGIAVVGAAVVFFIKKPEPTPLGEAFEEALQELELTGIKGIGSKRSEELKAAGISTVWDLATSSAKEKTVSSDNASFHLEHGWITFLRRGLARLLVIARAALRLRKFQSTSQISFDSF